MQINEIAKQLGLEIYDAALERENEHYIYRIYIKKSDKSSVNLDDCEKLSRLVSPILDLNPPTEHKYFLEVSSPGLERKLSKFEHFEKSIGELVRIKCKDKSEFSGKLIAANEDKITLENCEPIDFSEIKSARTYIEW